jgi:SAM-dependent methyltransferase
MADWQLRPDHARDDAEVRAFHEANRAAWNQGAREYTDRLDDAIQFLRAGRSNLHPVERANLGDLRAWCRSAVHLQCASGKDTLSLWIEGVEKVVGIDISDVHIANARRLSEAAGCRTVRWYRCDVLDTPQDLDGTADLVYSGRGAMFWVHDLDAWMAVVARLLRPGGVLHLLDDHPMVWLFDEEADHLKVDEHVDLLGLTIECRGWPDQYIGSLGMSAGQHAVKYERLWPLSAVVNAAVGAGLRVEKLGEHHDEYWDPLPHVPRERRRGIPLTFSLLAHRPSG